MSHMDTVAAEWLAARKNIADFLYESLAHRIYPVMSRESLEYTAAAIIARLAHHEPPLLIQTEEASAIAAAEAAAEAAVWERAAQMAETFDAFTKGGRDSPYMDGFVRGNENARNSLAAMFRAHALRAARAAAKESAS